jgi:glycosyltransferase involved in cell wall biosynthesis
VRTIRKAWRVLREQGVRAVIKRTGARLFGNDSIRRALVRYDDARDVDWTTPHPALTDPRPLARGPLVVAWIMSPPGLNSGGHQNIFRFIRFLEEAGHTARVYLYSTATDFTVAEVIANVRGSSSYPDVRAEITDLPVAGLPSDVDVVFATGWETAYPSFRDTSNARRLYFVQDFEPAFYAAGSEHALAENTYRFGFRAITAGRWLSTKLHNEFGMRAFPFDFGADPNDYRIEQRGPRAEVFFYARPATERRGFELGIMALDLLSQARPDVTINLVGEDLRHLDIPFRHTNLRGLGLRELNTVYNRCAVGLVLSFTNMSLLPLELLAAGVIPVVNDGPNNRMVSDNPYIEFAAAVPKALADRMLGLLQRDDLSARAIAGAKSTRNAGWDVARQQFIVGFEEAVHG